ncbi:MAG TPA: HtaA domain-containing protein, partial [Solirubrobacterales bacterium]
AATGAADGGAQKVLLPVRAGLVGSSVTVLRFGGGISFASGKHRLRLGGLRLTLGERASLAGKLGGESLGLFRVLKGGRREVDAARGSVRLSGLRLKLRASVAREIAERLRLEGGFPHGFGVLSVTKEGLQPGAPAPSGPVAKGSTSCPLPSTAGPAPEEPLSPPASPPAGSTAITGATVRWDVRESFIRYINSGEGTSVFDGATAAAPEARPASPVPLTYSFGFPFASGWHHPGANPSDPSDDKAGISFSGGVRFLYSGHGIDLRTSAPELEIAGGASRAIFAVAEGDAAPEREVIVNLDLSRAASVQASGSTVTYDRVPGAIPDGAATSVFAGFYAPGTDFGCFTVSYSTGS